MGKGMFGNCFHKVIILHFKKYLFIVINFLQILIFLHNFPGHNPICKAFSVFVEVRL